MDLDVKLNRKQEKLLLTLPNDISWCLRRMQGTGLRYWKLETAPGTDWEGEPVEFEARTLCEVVNQAKRYYAGV